jgi:ATP-dependent helicase/nuclease subunit A
MATNATASEAKNPRGVDEDARDMLKADLTRNLFVNAGAGSGKTTSMVKRICALVKSGTPMSGIVAITFTEKAAAELRNRIRVELEKQIPQGAVDTDDEDRELSWAEQALGELDAAPVGTIHSFAGRLLRENPIAAGVPPLLNIQDDLGSQIAFTQRWERISQTMFLNERAREAFDFLIFQGVTLAQIEKVARILDESWDRLADTAHEDIPDFPPIDGERILEILRAYAAMWELYPESGDDSLVTALRKLDAWCDELETTLRDIRNGDDEPNRLFEFIGTIPWPGKNLGSKKWGEVQEAVKNARVETEERVMALFGAHVETAIDILIRVMSSILLEEANARQLSGKLEFADLLILTRRMLRNVDNESTWKLIKAQYPVIMIDEYQDTDPIQAEIGLMLASTSHGAVTLGKEMSLTPGGLFTVGDPKQSIYRFRRADIGTFMNTADHLDEVVRLTRNFRSDFGLLAWVNDVFSDLIVANGLQQPAYQNLDNGVRSELQPEIHGPLATVLGSHVGPAESAGEARKAEALDVAQIIMTATGREPEVPGWMHIDIEKTNGEEIEHLRPLNLSDICILLPSRTSLPDLENALSEHDIEYTAEASSLVYNDPEIEALLITLDALANTANSAALVLALRSPLFGCSDADLLDWAADENPWNLLASLGSRVSKPDDAEGDSNVASDVPTSRVGQHIDYLRGLLDLLPYSSPADILNELIESRQYLAQQMEYSPRTREKFRRIRFIVDQARAWHEKTHGSLRDYLVWARIQQEDDARVKEPMIPENGRNAVRIMTIHASKGLEFPMVILSGASGIPQTNAPSVVWDSEGAMHVRLRGSATKELAERLGKAPIQTPGFADVYQVEREFELAEKRRLLYVACTRAMSHLVVSVHLQAKKNQYSPSLAETMRISDKTLELSHAFVTRDNVEWLPAPLQTKPQGITLSLVEWEVARAGWETLSTRPASFSITSLAKHPESAPVSDPFDTEAALSFEVRGTEEADYLKGRSGGKPRVKLRFMTDEERAELREEEAAADAAEAESGKSESLGGKNVGTAVHRTLELSNLSASSDVDRIAQSVCADLRITDWARVAELSRNALASPVVQSAAQREHWLELPMTFAHEGVVLEGVADLVYKNDDDELVVVDFKTDKSVTRDGLDSYWRQLTAYANLLNRATGMTVRSLTLVMCASNPAVDLTRDLISE